MNNVNKTLVITALGMGLMILTVLLVLRFTVQGMLPAKPILE